MDKLIGLARMGMIIIVALVVVFPCLVLMTLGVSIVRFENPLKILVELDRDVFELGSLINDFKPHMKELLKGWR